MERYRPIRRLPQHPLAATAVFEVYDQHDQRHKMLKVLQEPLRNRVARLRQEYSALMALNVPGRIPRPDLDGFFSIPTTGQPAYCLVMEKIEGQTLRQWIDAGNRCSQSSAIDWLRQLINLVTKIHDCYYLHRDIKPANLILRPDGDLALIDFEACRRLTETYFVKLRLAEAESPLPGNTYSITAVGSAGYMPQEQLHGGAMPQSDLFAIARTLVHAVTGIHPTQLPITETGKLLWRSQAPQIAPPLADLIDELQAPDWRNRPADVPSILRRIEQLPRLIRRYRLMRSTQLRVAAAIVSFGVLLSGAWVGQTWTVSQRLTQAQRAVETGATLQLDGELEPARQSYLRALDLDPYQVAALNNLGQLCKSERNFDCAIKYYQRALQIAPKTESGRVQAGQIYFNLGSAYEDQGERDQAIAQYQLAIQTDPIGTSDARNNLARLKNLQGKYKEAEQTAIQALAQTSDPISVSSLKKNLGWSLLKQSKLESAVTALTEAQQLVESLQRRDGQQLQTQTAIYCLLAQVQEGQGNRAKARQNWRECSASPADTDRFPEIADWRLQHLNQVDPLQKF
jgi:serine/threonine protein kinase